MLRASRLMWMMFVAFAGYSGGCSGGGDVGDACGGNGDCDGTLQCLNRQCAPQCSFAPQCGDGYACDDHGYCQKATRQVGESCQSEVDCKAGFSCQLDGSLVDTDNRPLSSCTAELAAQPAGATCTTNGDCRHGTCALGHCVDLCRKTRDCGREERCTLIPSELSANAWYWGCLPAKGAMTWSIPVARQPVGRPVELLLPVPNIARSAELVMSVDDHSQKVGATSVLSPAGARIYDMPCSPNKPPCDQIRATDKIFANTVRHRLGFGQSVLAIPSGLPPPPPPLSDSAPPTPLPFDTLPSLQPGIYRVMVQSFRANDTAGSALPHVTAVVQLAAGDNLDLHFFFLDLADHPCAALTNNAVLDASTAKTAAFFQKEYLDELRRVFKSAQLTLGASYDNITNHPELDGLDVADAGSLFTLGTYTTGINVFVVRSLSPVGLQVFGPNPGPAGLGGTRQSGIVIGLDTLCYRGWPAMARLTAHAIAHYMGLYHTVELETPQHPTWVDALGDTNGSSNNLMFFSERADSGAGTELGTVLTPQQSDILQRSAVLH